MLNNNPFFAIYGLPRIGDAQLLRRDEQAYRLTQEVSSYYAIEKTLNEKIELDGETYTSVFNWKYGLTDKLQLGIEIPYIRHTGGTLDGFINEWHELFDLPEGGRNFVANDRFLFRYERDGEVLIDYDQAERGIGDVSLTATWLGNDNPKAPWALSFSLNLPTGKAQYYHGNNHTDAALWYKAQTESVFLEMRSGYFYSLGLVYIGGTEILPQFVNQVAVFGGIGGGVFVTPDVVLMTQFDLHSPVYKGPEVNDLSGYSMQISVGGYIFIDAGNKIHISVGEDLALDVSPDITFHLGYEWLY